MAFQEIIETIKESKHKKVKLAICDIDGILRGKVISKDKFMEIVEGNLGFCDVVFGWDAADTCYTNAEVTGWHTAYPDAKASLDLSTYREIPWNDKLPFFLGDFRNDSKMEEASCPRSLLNRVSKKTEQMGYLPIFSQEFEWFNFIGKPNDIAAKNFSELQPLSPGMFGYSMLRPTLYQDYFNDLFDLLQQFNVPLEGLHTETGPGVYEAAIRYDEIMMAADKAALFKNSVKEIAYKHGIVASFMAKWNQQLPGCSGHIHQSLWDLNQETNQFFDISKPDKMSDTMKHYLAGLLYCLPHIMPMYAPTINSYKRLVDGAWAPTTASWGFENRTTAVRLINGGSKSHRLEMRLPGSDTNPYLAMAASLASGLYGIEHKLELKQAPTIGNAYADKNLKKLWSNLNDATTAMKESEIAHELFGTAFVNHFCGTREWEWKQYEVAVTNWELKRYFEII